MKALLLAVIACNPDLWPGFDPCAIPVAIFDGTRTTLQRHPSPPAGFRKHGDAFVFEGRHPAVNANSSAMIGGVDTATVMPGGDAATIAHELFHVYQTKVHPDWGGNEVDLFAYPVADAAQHALVRLELDALRHALTERSADWARAALAIRDARYAKLDAASIAYERGMELKEGLATYVGHRAVATPDERVVPARGFRPEAVRDRLYVSGAAYARLLDAHAPQWRAALERKTTPLDVLLAAALEDTAAKEETAALRERIAEQRRAFVEAPGHGLRIRPATPLFPERFDPLNVRLVAPGEVLHTRMLRLSNDGSSLEILGRSALTVAAGAHPLFQGMREVTLTGFTSPPKLTERDGVITIEAEGVSGRIRGSVNLIGDRASSR